MTARCLIVGALLLGGQIASADEYWIAYEGNDFPENEGWWHIWGDVRADRRIEDGSLVIDGLADIRIVDFYQMPMNGTLDPGPGETFIMQWRLRVDEVVSRRGLDPGVSVFSDDMWAVSLRFGEDRVESVFETNVRATFEPGVFHEFELRSSDMRSYQFLIDGELAINGSFWFSLIESRVGWGDVIEGARSLSRWDYVRFGVVPEPQTLLLFGGVLIRSISSRRSP